MKETIRFNSKDWQEECQRIQDRILEVVGRVDFSVEKNDGEFIDILFALPGCLNSNVEVETDIDIVELRKKTEINLWDKTIPIEWVSNEPAMD